MDSLGTQQHPLSPEDIEELLSPEDIEELLAGVMTPKRKSFSSAIANYAMKHHVPQVMGDTPPPSKRLTAEDVERIVANRLCGIERSDVKKRIEDEVITRLTAKLDALITSGWVENIVREVITQKITNRLTVPSTTKIIEDIQESMRSKAEEAVREMMSNISFTGHQKVVTTHRKLVT